MADRWVIDLDACPEGPASAWESTMGRRAAWLMQAHRAAQADGASPRLLVTPGFVLTTHAFSAWERAGRQLTPEFLWRLDGAVAELERRTGCGLGDAAAPLVLSVRASAHPRLEPLLPTLRHVGLPEPRAEASAAAWLDWVTSLGDALQFGCGVDPYYVQEEHHRLLRELRLRDASEMTVPQIRELSRRLRSLDTDRMWPGTAADQLRLAVQACFMGCAADRVVREQNRRRTELPTAMACLVTWWAGPAEVADHRVCRSRDPATGEPTVAVLDGAGRPVVGDAFERQAVLSARLEAVAQDAVEIASVESASGLWVVGLQPLPRQPEATLRIASDLAAAGRISDHELLRRVSPQVVESLLHPRIDPGATRDVLARGLGASPGAATGPLVFDAAAVADARLRGERAILLRHETGPEDVRAMVDAAGVVTARGGITSHAAVVARQLGRPCIVGCSQLDLHAASREVVISGRVLAEGHVVTLDGATGELLDGGVTTSRVQAASAFQHLMACADAVRTLGVRANIDNADDAARALDHGAEGVGLARTEHMFLQGGRIATMREMILAPHATARKAALAKLRPEQEADFEAIFRSMAGRPVTIRLLDPPLHEFLPARAEEFDALSRRSGVPVVEIEHMVDRLREANPMLGHRGCRVGITYPEIYDAQVDAALSAAHRVERSGGAVELEVMVPLVALASEFERVRQRVHAAVARERDRGLAAQVRVGAMVELPRACLIAGQIAASADFLSFGTNDLTQTVFGFSRDDVAGFLPSYLHSGALEHDPFLVLDLPGVGRLIEIAVREARAVKPDIVLGLCGEHGGDAATIAWLQSRGFAYVSVAPARIPVARVAAARAVLEGAA